MEVNKIKIILTAVGNPLLNNELKKIKEFKIINYDIQYQEGILEYLEKNNKINYLILSQFLPGNYILEDLINKINEFNNKIKIIIILEKYNINLENILKKIGVYRILYNNKIEINNIIKIINENEKMEKYNEEIQKEIDELKNNISKKRKKENRKINNLRNKIIKNKIVKKINIKKINIKKYVNYIKEKTIKNKKENKIVDKINNKKNNKINNKLNNKTNNKINNKTNNKINNIINNKNIISILGNNGSGKSIFSIILAFYSKNYFNKILIIDFDILNNSLHTILGIKNNKKIKNKINNYENYILKINNKIDLLSGINILFNIKNNIKKEDLINLINNLKNEYDLIIIDTTSECYFEYTKELINLSTKCIFLTEANLSEISKSKRLLYMYFNNWEIKKDKIKILINKFNLNTINNNLLKIIFSEYKILGFIKYNKLFNIFINSILKCFIFQKIILKKYVKK